MSDYYYSSSSDKNLRKQRGFNSCNNELQARFGEARRQAEKDLRHMTHRPENQRGKRRIRRAAQATALHATFGKPVRGSGW